MFTFADFGLRPSQPPTREDWGALLQICRSARDQIARTGGTSNEARQVRDRFEQTIRHAEQELRRLEQQRPPRPPRPVAPGTRDVERINESAVRRAIEEGRNSSNAHVKLMCGHLIREMRQHALRLLSKHVHKGGYADDPRGADMVEHATVGIGRATYHLDMVHQARGWVIFMVRGGDPAVPAPWRGPGK